jgi:hypothetical protein
MVHKGMGDGEMKSHFALLLKLVIALSVMLILIIPAVNAADIIRISDIDESKDVGKEVTISGTITAISNNIETDNVQTYEPGEAYKEIILVFVHNDKIKTYEVGEVAAILMLDDKTGKILVSVEPLLLKEPFLEGQKVVVTGLYAGNANMPDVKGLIYADRVYPYMERGYRAVTVEELKDQRLLYFQSPVCIEGNVTQIVLAAGKTDLKVHDDPSDKSNNNKEIDVLYRKELDDLKIDDWIIIEGEFQRNMIYAFSVQTEHVEPTPSPSPSPSPSPTSTPAPPTTPRTTFTPLPVEEEGLPFYVIVIIIAILAVVGIVAAIKLREWLMFRRYG